MEGSVVVDDDQSMAVVSWRNKMPILVKEIKVVATPTIGVGVGSYMRR